MTATTGPKFGDLLCVSLALVLLDTGSMSEALAAEMHNDARKTKLMMHSWRHSIWHAQDKQLVLLIV